MGCCSSKMRPPPPPPPPPLPPPPIEDCISRFQTINTVDGVDCLIDIIDKLLETLPNKSNEDKVFSDLLNERSKSVWKSFLDSGSLFLEFVNKQIQVEQVDDETREAVARILRQVGDVHWVVGGLSVVAFLLEQHGQISKNRKECIELLKQMAKLAGHIRKLNNDMP